MPHIAREPGAKVLEMSTPDIAALFLQYSLDDPPSMVPPAFNMWSVFQVTERLTAVLHRCTVDS